MSPFSSIKSLIVVIPFSTQFGIFHGIIDVLYHKGVANKESIP